MDVFTGRQHGDHVFCITDALGNTGCSQGTGLNRVVNALDILIKGAHLMTRLGQISAHAAAHVAQSNESDITHRVPFSSFVNSLSAGVAAFTTQRCCHRGDAKSGCATYGLLRPWL